MIIFISQETFRVVFVNLYVPYAIFNKNVTSPGPLGVQK